MQQQQRKDLIIHESSSKKGLCTYNLLNSAAPTRVNNLNECVIFLLAVKAAITNEGRIHERGYDK